MSSSRSLRFRRFAIHTCAGIAADSVLTALCTHFQPDLATTSLLFLLVNVFAALDGALSSSLVLSLAGAAFLDYYFVPPIHSWRVASAFELTSLITFAITSLITTRLAARAREAARESERRRESLEHLCEAGKALLALEPGGSIPQLLRVLRKIFRLRAVCLFDGLAAEMHCEGESPQLATSTRAAYITGICQNDAELPTHIRSLLSAGKVTATLGFEQLRDPDLNASPLATMTLATLERLRAFESANRSAAEASAETFRAAILDGLAHELKTPLSIIMTAAGGLGHAGALNQHQRELAESIETEAARLSHLASRLLRQSALEQDQVAPQMKSGDLSALVANVVERYSCLFDDRRIRFECPQGSARVMFDEELIRIALSQLLDNAVKYSKPGSEIVTTVISLPGLTRIHVWNDGSSVPSCERHRIFDRFYRGDGSQARTSGSGLGLYVARKIARAHSGSLDLDPEGQTDNSAAFCLTLAAPGESIYANTHSGTVSSR